MIKFNWSVPVLVSTCKHDKQYPFHHNLKSSRKDVLFSRDLSFFFLSFFLSLSNNNILSLMGVKIGNVGFCIFIFIWVLENDFWKQKLFFHYTPANCACGGGGGVYTFSHPSVSASICPFAMFWFSNIFKRQWRNFIKFWQTYWYPQVEHLFRKIRTRGQFLRLCFP